MGKAMPYISKGLDAALLARALVLGQRHVAVMQTSPFSNAKWDGTFA
jgi:hypothetical protein